MARLYDKKGGIVLESNIYFNPVSKKRVSEVIYDQIFEKISTKELKPGDRLPSERELAAQFGCGRPSVREALRMLQQDDLIAVDVGANGGATIKHSIMDSAIHPIQRLVGVGAISLSDLVVYRKYNDKACMELAMENATSEDLKKLQQILFDYDKNLKNADKVHRIDIMFHEYFARASHNNVCLLVAKIITSFSTELFYNLTEQADQSMVYEVNKEAYRNHLHIFEAIRDKDYSQIDYLTTEAAQQFGDTIRKFNDID